jgi:general secretion pathway protein B
MSYILEALKKVERKREQEEPPKLLALLGRPGPEAKKRPVWLYPLMAALFLNAGIMVWWIAPWQSEIKGSRQRLAPVSPAGPAFPDRPQAISRPAGKKETKALTQDLTRQARLQGENKAPRNLPAAVVPRERTTESKPVEKPAPPQTVKEKETPPPGKVFNFNDLPQAVKSALPEFKVSTHVFSSDPQGRLVRINDKMLQEGQELHPGLRLEQIIPGGLVLSFKEYRFRLELAR